MISWLLRGLSLTFCLLLSCGLLLVPPLLLPAQLTVQNEAQTEKEAQLQLAEGLNKKKTAVFSTDLALGKAQPPRVDLPASFLDQRLTVQLCAQVAKPKVLAVPVGRLALPFQL